MNSRVEKAVPIERAPGRASVAINSILTTIISEGSNEQLASGGIRSLVLVSLPPVFPGFVCSRIYLRNHRYDDYDRVWPAEFFGTSPCGRAILLRLFVRCSFSSWCLFLVLFVWSLIAQNFPRLRLAPFTRPRAAPIFFHCVEHATSAFIKCIYPSRRKASKSYLCLSSFICSSAQCLRDLFTDNNVMLVLLRFLLDFYRKFLSLE